MNTAALRSLLFVPGDSERKQAKALGSGADALILDLEDSVASAQLPAAREKVRALLSAQSGGKPQTEDDTSAPQLRAPQLWAPQLWVRVNGPSSGLLLDDLVAVMAGRPQGIVLPKVSSAGEVSQVASYLSALEAREGQQVGATRLLVIATETPTALLTLRDYALDAGAARPMGLERLAGLTWGVEDLSAALGALGKTIERKTTEGGSGNERELTPALQLARSLCLIAAAAAGVQAIDGVQPDFRDAEGLARELRSARRDGFTAKMAIHPDQVPAINAAFAPTPEEVEHARRVVAAFNAATHAGVTSLDGQMLDKPHLVLAHRVLALSARAGKGGSQNP